jgi:hypothetical protein
MKDQYAGDINDYLKYALLRGLAGAHAGTLQVWWMRTAGDGRSDGARLAYLKDPGRFRALDAPLFDALTEMISGGRRNVRAVQDAAILPCARFHASLLSDEPAARAAHFQRVLSSLGSDDLVFFDPDNGLQVKSVPLGRRNCCKYLYWEELEQALGGQRSVIVYQHFPRRPRAQFTRALLNEFTARHPDRRAFAICSPWVAYLVCAPPAQARALHRAARRVSIRAPTHLELTPICGSARRPSSGSRKGRVIAS